jgi:type II secretory pathway pseudopilin PulG
MMRRRGFSLAETLVSMSIVILVLTMTADILTPCMHVWSANQNRASAEENGLLLGRNMRREISASHLQSVTYRSAEPTALSFLSSEGAAPNPQMGWDGSTGKPLWRKFVIYYVEASTHRLYRKEWPNLQSATQVPALSVALPSLTVSALPNETLRNICLTTNGSEHVVAERVVSLDYAVPSPNSIDVTLMLSSDADPTLHIAKPMWIALANTAAVTP